MTTIILSDIHLGARNNRADLLAPFLASDFDRLILNGDTIDSLNFRRFRPSDWQIVELLQVIARERELILIRGNHEGRAADRTRFGSLNMLANLLGSEMHEEYELTLNDGRYLVLHGDQFDQTLNLTWVGDAADWCYNQIQRISKPTARWLKGRVKHLGGVVSSVRAGATAYAQKRGFTGVITGHTHYHDDEREDGFRYLNTGCWVDWPCTYIRITNGEARLLHWEGSVPASNPELELTAVG
jgi:UDP-2,3-diacylglucosamine pyrophosphatase LpxH